MGKAKPVKKMTVEQQEMVMANLGLANDIAYKLWKSSKYVRRISLAEARQAACYGLMKAVLCYDKGKARLSTYAYLACQREVFFAADKGGVISLPNLRGADRQSKNGVCQEDINRALNVKYSDFNERREGR